MKRFRVNIRLHKKRFWSERINYMQSRQSDIFRKMIILTCILMVLPVFSSALEIPVLKLKYGKLERSRDITNKFETYQILPDHKYYIHGWGTVPYAIIGVQNKFKLRKGLWKEVEITAPLLRSWVSQMDSIYGYPPYGSRILDHKGNPIGVWYSSKQWTTVVIEEDNQIAIFAPEAPGFRGGADQ
jgi:hypothetical protein